ncbi:DUF1015 domain-containing protein [Mesoaciditoga lauensis]|uniref:DUF1015 domain-containing protein n=1 Tax=Mesoaciditoga lauensis TaxID=1495039 RepID=UPI00055DE3EF|nr:DUF1015 family protein [Mesoaciditoga lauensis]
MIVRAFRALRPDPKYVEKVQCPPYDVVTKEEAEEYAREPYSFMRVIRPEVVAKEGESIYEVAARELKRLISENVLVREEKPKFYLYSQTMGKHTQTGLVACVAAEEYPEKIKRHELTRTDKERERMNHILATRANTGQVFLTYRNNDELDDLLNVNNGKLLYEVKSKNPDVIHRIYSIEDEKIAQSIVEAFQKVPAFYIADGHHRASASARVSKELGGEGEWNYFMATIFPHNELQLMGYHRVIKDLNGLTEKEFLEKLQKANFDVAEVDGVVEPKTPHHFGMYLLGRWYELRATKVNEKDPIERLDVSILQQRVLDPILGIKNPRTDSRIDFVGGIRGIPYLESLVDSKDYVLAFALYPTRIEDVMEVADSNLFMPPKSTWFEPKLQSGLLIHTF